MFQLSPVTLKPEIRASRSQHGQFQAKITTLVEKIIGETEVLGLENKNAQQLFNAMDTFFSYGLLSGDKIYWNFVREFLPRTEQRMLRAEWGNINDRRLSLAWLKDAFNKGSLGFQMLAFKSNKKLVSRFYHKNACLCNGGMLEAVTFLMERVVTVQFAFYSQLTLRMEPVHAVVVEPPVSSCHKVTKARKRRETEGDHAKPASPDVQIPLSFQELPFGTPADQDLILDDLVRSRRNRMNSERLSFEKEDGFNLDVENTVSLTEPPTEVGLDDVLSKTISQVRMDHLCDGPRSFDSLLHLDVMKHETSEEEKRVEGEEIPNPGDVMQLAIDVFLEQCEKPLHMYNVYENFSVGNPLRRLVAITDHNVYIISKIAHLAPDALSSAGVSSANVQSGSVYHAHTIMPLNSIDYIGVSMDSQVIHFYAKASSPFSSITGENRQASPSKLAVISTGDQLLGNAILKSLENASKELGSTPAPIFRDSTPYSLILKRYISKELCTSPTTDISYLGLVFWKESSASMNQQKNEHSGFLYWRFNPPNWWRKPPMEYEQSFFLLPQDRKLYVFKDSSMKEGVVIYDLRNCTETLELDQKKDFQWSFELVFPEGNLQMLSQSKEELCRWMQLISSALTQLDEDSASASMLILTESDMVVAQEGNRCLTDGFVRTLVSFSLTEIRSGWIVRSNGHFALLLRVDVNYEWFIFRSDSELTRIISLLSKYPIVLTEAESVSNNREMNFIVSQFARMPDLWTKSTYEENEPAFAEN